MPKAKAKQKKMTAAEEAALAASATEAVDPAELEAAASTAERKGKVYAKQKADAPKKGANTQSKKAEKAEPSKKRRGLTGDTASERIRSAFSSKDDLHKATQLHASQGATVGNASKILALIDGMSAKKVREKAVNLIVNRDRPESVSIFTRLAVKRLLEAGSTTSAELAKLYRECGANGGKGYSEGTARAQANQMMALLPELKVASRDGKVLTLDKDSIIANEIQAAA